MARADRRAAPCGGLNRPMPHSELVKCAERLYLGGTDFGRTAGSLRSIVLERARFRLSLQNKDIRELAASLVCQLRYTLYSESKKGTQ